jgi:hypothetical protein
MCPRASLLHQKKTKPAPDACCLNFRVSSNQVQQSNFLVGIGCIFFFFLHTRAQRCIHLSPQIPSSDDFIGITASGTLYGLKGAVSLVPGSAPANEEGGAEKRSRDADLEGGNVKRVHVDGDGEPRS